ncbi:PhzF family phenazine biosynthesis protein [Marispirochaeta aestuarii]|uniref:PhzF family phenazine biosynthesis protein n=1 Tax=Marispirochaeta aestuarii TaxID=1963862 RepID=UPI0029C93915|nr:PhzF family phenazine biosynthesis protein [Marispirochaeta aestuarii]
MRIDFFHVDAFTSRLFGGNPAAVCILEDWPSEEIMLSVAKEFFLPETAFCVREAGTWRIRWFTPEIEMDLCGHASLAAAFVIRNFVDSSIPSLVFLSRSGELSVSFRDDRIVLDFPSRPPRFCELPETIARAVNIQPREVLKARDYILVYPSEGEVRNIRFDRNILDEINLDPGGISVTARAEEGSPADFVSRFFTPQASIFEDPVTGSAHSTLVPYWSGILGKENLLAFQVSRRGGELFCRNQGERVSIAGKAVLFCRGSIAI